MKIFLGAQYGIIACQSVMLWQLAWSYFVVDYGIMRDRTWQVSVSLACQCILVLSANIFLADQIHTLTRCRLKSAFIIALSIASFAFGMGTIWLILFGHLSPSGGLTRAQTVLSAFWHGLQVIVECFISYSLIRGHLNARKSGCAMSYLYRRLVQLGIFAMIWAILGLMAFAFMPKVCSLFDMTVGSLYTHVVFDTLRHRLSENSTESNQFDMALTAQVSARADSLTKCATLQSPPRTFDGKGSSSAAQNVLVMANLSPSAEMAPQSTWRLSRDNVSEIECAPAGQPGVTYEPSYASYIGEF